FAASGIAGSEPMKTGMTAVRLGIAAFIVPYIFVYGEALLLIGSVQEIILAVVTAIIGIMGIASVTEGWLLRHAFWYERTILFAGSILMIIPGVWTDIAGIVILTAVYIIQRNFKKDLLPE